MKKFISALFTAALVLACAPHSRAALAQPTSAPARPTAYPEVQSSYAAEFLRVEPGSGWNGDVAGCIAGTTTDEFKASVLQRVNWFRAAAGLDPVGYDHNHDSETQASALIQSASGFLSHVPAQTQPCWTSTGLAGSFRSNIALGMNGIDAINAYMEDYGSYNTGVGHRMWLLSPTLGAISTGDVSTSDLLHWSSNALWVTNDASMPSRARDGVIAWPAPGAVADALVPGRWSFDANVAGDSFANATVSMNGPTGPVKTTIVSTGGALVWEPAIARDVNSDTTYTVTVSGATAKGVALASKTYQVTLVNVNRIPAMAVAGYGSSTCAAPGQPVSGAILTDDTPGLSMATLVTGPHSEDNAKFRIVQRVSGEFSLTPIVDLPLTQTTYTTRFRVIDAEGAVFETPLRFTLSEPTVGKTACPASDVTAEVSKDSTAVTFRWNLPPAHSTSSRYTVTASSPINSGSCRSTGQTCTIQLTPGTYSFTVATLLGDESAQTPTMTVVVPARGTNSGTAQTAAPGSRARITRFVTVPAGARRFSVTGQCHLSSDHKWVHFSTSAGQCRISVVGRKSVNGRMKSVSSTATVTVT